MRAPSISGEKLISILKRFGFREVRQSGDHVRLEKQTPEKSYKITVPLHDPLKKKTLLSILTDSDISLEDLQKEL